MFASNLDTAKIMLRFIAMDFVVIYFSNVLLFCVSKCESVILSIMLFMDLIEILFKKLNLYNFSMSYMNRNFLQ